MRGALRVPPASQPRLRSLSMTMCSASFWVRPTHVCRGQMQWRMSSTTLGCDGHHSCHGWRSTQPVLSGG